MDGWLIRKGYEYVGREEGKTKKWNTAEQGENSNRGRILTGDEDQQGKDSRGKNSNRGKDFNRAKRNPAGGCFWSQRI